MNKFKTPAKIGIFGEKRKRKRITNAKECQKDMNVAYNKFLQLFTKL